MTPERLPIRTDRLVLRPTTAADSGRAFEIQSDWQVTQMLRMASFPPDRDAMAEWFAEHEREWRAGTACRFAVEREGRMIGLADLDEIAGGQGDLGYWFEQAAWGQGYAFEAASVLRDFAFRELGLARLNSGHAADNAASGRVLAKLGFRPLDTVEVFSNPRGKNIRQCRYAMEAPPRRSSSGNARFCQNSAFPSRRFALILWPTNFQEDQHGKGGIHRSRRYGLSHGGASQGKGRPRTDRL